MNEVTKLRSNLRPLHKNILVEKLTREQLGKIVLPDSVQDDWLRGRVIATGPDISNIDIPPTKDGGLIKVEPAIKVGDIVIYPPAPPHLGDYPVIGDDGYIILSENMILAIED